MTTSSDLLDRLHHVRTQIAAAASMHGRDPQAVRLLAVSKQQPAYAIRTLVTAGQCDFAENYLQEALEKIAAFTDLDLIWHFIGQIQSNKTRLIANHFHWVHTITRSHIARRLHEQRPHHAPPLQVCIQVKLADEFGKAGVWPTEVPALAKQITSLSRLKLRGLMCIPPPTTEENSHQTQQHFNTMQQLLTALRQQNFDVDTLSMGMSTDFVAAIAAGATLVRIGTALFGERVTTT